MYMFNGRNVQKSPKCGYLKKLTKYYYSIFFNLLYLSLCYVSETSCWVQPVEILTLLTPQPVNERKFRKTEGEKRQHRTSLKEAVDAGPRP